MLKEYNILGSILGFPYFGKLPSLLLKGQKCVQVSHRFWFGTGLGIVMGKSLQFKSWVWRGLD